MTRTVTICSDRPVQCSEVLEQESSPTGFQGLSEFQGNLGIPELQEMEPEIPTNTRPKVDCQSVTDFYGKFNCRRCEMKANFYPDRALEPQCQRYASEPVCIFKIYYII